MTLGHAGDDAALVAKRLAAAYQGQLDTPVDANGTFLITLSSATAALIARDPEVAQVAAPDAAASWSLGTYEYDGAGNISTTGTSIYVYDGEGRLLREKSGTQTGQALTYDGFGNIRSITEGSNAYTVGASSSSNRASVASSAVNHVYGTYDGAGNMITAGTNTYAYDALNVMTRSKMDVSRAYVYNANDERVGTMTLTGPAGSEVGSQWTIRDPAGQVLRRFSRQGGQWRWMQDYIYRDGKMLASESNDQLKTLHYHLDHLGSPRLITGNGGVEVARHTYYPFGEEVPGATPQVAEPKKFTGHERDGGGLDYMQARYYEYSMGRFLSVDPLMDPSRNMRMPQRWNRYAYALNNPLLRVDPDGRKDTIFVVNTSNAGAFNRTAQARLTAAVGGTRFEGRVQVVGPFATAGQVHSSLAQADRTDMVAVLGHSGSTKEWAPGKGGMMFAEKKGQWVTGATLAAWASSGAGPGVCMVSGCNSAQLAATVSAGANTTTLGTTANVVGGELGMATAVALGALAQGQSPDAAAAAASQELKTPANHCDGNPSCDPNEVARVVVVPPQ